MTTNHHNERSEVKLEPCPFCGGKAAWGEGEQKTKYGNEQVYCTNCWATTAPEGSKAEAAENWNSRASVAAPRHYFCSCGGALTAEEYIAHYFEMGHDRGDPAFTPVAAPVSTGEHDETDAPEHHAKTCDRWVQCDDHEHYESIVNCTCAATSTTPVDGERRDAVRMAEAVMEVMGNPGVSPQTWDRLVEVCAAATTPPAVTEAGEQEHEIGANDHPYFTHARSCKTCGPDGFCSEGLRLYTANTAPPSTSEVIKQAAEEIVGPFVRGSKFRHKDRVQSVTAILSHYFSKGETGSPLLTRGNHTEAIRLLRELRETTDPDEIQRQKDSWAQLEAALNPAAPGSPSPAEPPCPFEPLGWQSVCVDPEDSRRVGLIFETPELADQFVRAFAAVRGDSLTKV